MSRAGAVVFVASALALGGCGPDVAAREVCGYRCGPSQSCPDGFACYADGRCHREGSPESRGCTLDGGPDTAPTIASAYPADNETQWPTDRAIEIVFDEPVVGAETAITLRHRSVFDPVPATVSYNGEARTATVVPANPLDNGATYTITVAATITDATGNPFIGRSWEFTTFSDVTPPGIATVSPSPGATNVGVETPIVITFDEPVHGVTPSSFTVQDASGVSAGAITYVSPMLVKRTGLWSPNTTYRVTMASSITDLAANPLQGAPQTWLFRTGPDTVPPRITNQSPGVNAVEVPRSSLVLLYFSEPMIGISSATVFLDRDGVPVPSTQFVSSAQVLEVAPVGGLEAHVTYRVTILPAVRDRAGNPIAPGVLSWTFTTGATP